VEAGESGYREVRVMRYGRRGRADRPLPMISIHPLLVRQARKEVKQNAKPALPF
jgi:hypothetical protein